MLVVERVQWAVALRLDVTANPWLRSAQKIGRGTDCASGYTTALSRDVSCCEHCKTTPLEARGRYSNVGQVGMSGKNRPAGGSDMISRRRRKKWVFFVLFAKFSL